MTCRPEKDPRATHPSFRAASIALAMLCCVANRAAADVIKCVFTEPFITTIYSTTQNTLTVEENSEKRTEVVGGISLQFIAPGVFELWAQDKRPLQRLELNFGGSDGMSDNLYPYAVHWIAKDLRGGCTSNQLPMKKR